MVAPEQRIPAAVGLHPLLPGLEQFLHGEVIDAARGDQLLQVLVDVAAIGVEAAAVALVVILVKFGLGNDVDDVETEALDALRLPESQDVGHFLPHGGVLPVQVGLHDVVKMQIPFAKARHVFPRGAAEF